MRLAYRQHFYQKLFLKSMPLISRYTVDLLKNDYTYVLISRAEDTAQVIDSIFLHYDDLNISLLCQKIRIFMVHNRNLHMIYTLNYDGHFKQIKCNINLKYSTFPGNGFYILDSGDDHFIYDSLTHQLLGKIENVYTRETIVVKNKIFIDDINDGTIKCYSLNLLEGNTPSIVKENEIDINSWEWLDACTNYPILVTDLPPAPNDNNTDPFTINRDIIKKYKLSKKYDKSRTFSIMDSNTLQITKIYQFTGVVDYGIINDFIWFNNFSSKFDLLNERLYQVNVDSCPSDIYLTVDPQLIKDLELKLLEYLSIIPQDIVKIIIKLLF